LAITIISKYNFRFLLLFIYTVIFALSCKVFNKPKNSASNGETAIANLNSTEEIKRKYSYIFHNAVKEKILGNYDAAIPLFKELIKINDKEPAAYFELAQLYVYAGKPDYSLELMQKAYQLDGNNEWYGLFYAQLLKQFNKNSEASLVYKNLSEKFPTNPEFKLNFANLLINAEKYDEALQIFEKLEQEFGLNEEVIIRKQRIYLKKNNIEKAASELNKLIESNTDDPKFLLLLAEMYANNEDNKKAEEIYSNAIEKFPGNGMVYLSTAEFYKSIKNSKGAEKYYLLAFADKELPLEYKIKTVYDKYMLLETDSSQVQSLINQLTILKNIHPDDGRIYALSGDVYYKLNDFNKASENYSKAVEFDKNNYALWTQLMFALSETNQNERLVKYAEEALTYFPSQPIFYLMGGISQFQMKKYKEAANLLESGAAITVDNKAMLAQFYSSLGDTYHQLGDHKKSDASYDKSLSVEPENLYVLNNYAYYLSERNTNLSKAAEMSFKTITKEPLNSTFLDTYAWILYKQEKFDDALLYILKAIENGGSKSTVILEHTGDIYFKKSNLEKALEYWNKALEKDANSDKLKQKINQKKIID
jgi:tetratricopeptide (TPR) repeat protein